MSDTHSFAPLFSLQDEERFIKALREKLGKELPDIERRLLDKLQGYGSLLERAQDHCAAEGVVNIEHLRPNEEWLKGLAGTAAQVLKREKGLLAAAGKRSGAPAEDKSFMEQGAKIHLSGQAAEDTFDAELTVLCGKIEGAWNKGLLEKVKNTAGVEKDQLEAIIGRVGSDLNTRKLSADAEVGQALSRLDPERAAVLGEFRVFNSIENVWLGAKHLFTFKEMGHGKRGTLNTGMAVAGALAVADAGRRAAFGYMDDDTGKTRRDWCSAGAEGLGGTALLATALKMAEKNVRGL